MRNIAIVEDEDLEAELLISQIEKFSLQEKTEFNIVRFCSATDFLCDYEPIYAVVFMDIQMPGINGMDATFELRKIDKTVSLIFITSLIQHAQKGYEVDAVSFLIKPVSYFDFSLKFKKALDIYTMNEGRSVTLNTSSGVCCISTDKLKYVEIYNHKLKYHLVDQVIEMSGSLSNAEVQLNDCGFLRCNNCYLVNPKFVRGVKGFEVTVGDEVLRISRPRRKPFMAELTNWYAGAKK